MEDYTTLAEAIERFKASGYLEDFNLKQNCLECRNGEYKIFHNEFQIVNAIRFDVNTDPSDQAILYVITSDKYGLKGLLVNGYGIYTDELTNEMAVKLKYH